MEYDNPTNSSPYMIFSNGPELIPRMGSIKETAKEFHLPVHMIRVLVSEGKVAHIGTKKIYVNWESLIAYLRDANKVKVVENGEETVELCS